MHFGRSQLTGDVQLRRVDQLEDRIRFDCDLLIGAGENALPDRGVTET